MKRRVELRSAAALSPKPGEGGISGGMETRDRRMMRLLVDGPRAMAALSKWKETEQRLAQVVAGSMSCFRTPVAHVFVVEGAMEFVHIVVSLFLQAWSGTTNGRLSLDLVIPASKADFLVTSPALQLLLQETETDVTQSVEDPVYPGELRITLTGYPQNMVWPIVNIVQVTGEGPFTVKTPPSHSPTSPQVSPAITPNGSHWQQEAPLTSFLLTPSTGPPLVFSTPLRTHTAAYVVPYPQTPSPLELYQAMTSLIPRQSIHNVISPHKRDNAYRGQRRGANKRFSKAGP